MKKSNYLLLALMLMLASFTASAEVLRGDVNNDDKVNIEDVTDLIDYLLTGDDSGISLANADADCDGKITIEDVTDLIDYLLTGAWEEDPVTPPVDHDWVDLGLPNGTLWATCNVGATSPEEYGDYFAWGETEAKSDYVWSTYKWCNGSYNTMTKYCTESRYGYNSFVDNYTELVPEDDAAYVNWGPSWRMPTLDQIAELYDNCSWQRTQRNGVSGYLFTGPNGNTMFLPTAGYRWGSLLGYSGSYGFYWSRTLNSDGPRYAYYLYFGSGYVYWNYSYNRYFGLAVRAVRFS